MSRSNTLSRHAYNRAYQIERRQELKAAGLCQWCGIHPARPSRRSPTGKGCRCDACAKKAARVTRANLRRRRPAWAYLGICQCCGSREAMPQACRCAYCAEKQDEYKAHRKSKRSIPNSNSCAEEV